MGARTFAAAVAAATVLAGLGGCVSVDTANLDEPRGDGGGGSSSDVKVDVAEARDKLAGLEVKGRAPMTGFDRDEFGPAWADVDRNGCDTRNDILKRDLEDETFKKGTHDCIVLTGTLHDPYSGKTIEFRRGQETSLKVQIDHVVALADAWQKGAQRWPEERRKEFANDPDNLLAVDGPLNGQKGAGDAATWLPPRRGYRCAYVARQIDVKAEYELWVTSAEKAAMERILDGC
ncbi:hypothetical protein HNP84_002829 [Thermocatellispora tengchongensis]|uniref:GmrSD restriction endonucleases C-terminal domain-containing protein n=1 Tax=Thermocatellispora tengchongensis TaxID=1073253 RepID=A0A840P054_9ACTN|nr:HNH endonuclease family protein [Thermocatellispora tengchongensis]MBB5133108.1 hypothetical protein [Thermocatellispora tengchongensis]